MVGRPKSTLTKTEQQHKWNKHRYETNHYYHKLRYLQIKYPYIFVENKEILKKWLIDHHEVLDMEFINLIRTFIIKTSRSKYLIEVLA